MRSSPRNSAKRTRGRRLPLLLLTVAVFAAISLSNDHTPMRARSAPQVIEQGTVSGATPILSATGLTGLQLGDEHMTYTVATRNANGTVRVQHAAGGAEAKRQVMAGANGGTTAERERTVER